MRRTAGWMLIVLAVTLPAGGWFKASSLNDSRTVELRGGKAALVAYESSVLERKVRVSVRSPDAPVHAYVVPVVDSEDELQAYLDLHGRPDSPYTPLAGVTNKKEATL